LSSTLIILNHLLEETDQSTNHHEPSSPPTIESPKPSNTRLPKGLLGLSLPTADLNSDSNKAFRLIIHDGITKDQTEDFLQFRQCYCSMWGNIVNIFRRLEKLMFNYFVPIALINGEK
jgi:hypothetical protein